MAESNENGPLLLQNYSKTARALQNQQEQQ